MTRKEIIAHISLHTLGKTRICGHHQKSTVTTLKSQYKPVFTRGRMDDVVLRVMV